MTYNGIGLFTPRGSGTNGYITRNLSWVPERKQRSKAQFDSLRDEPPARRGPNPEIMEHERKRAIELKVMEWAEREGLLDGDFPDDVVQTRMSAKREALKKLGLGLSQDVMSKSKETHKFRMAQEKRAQEFQNAFKVRRDYVPGTAFDRELQEQRKKERMDRRIEEAKQIEMDKLELEEREKEREEQVNRYREKERNEIRDNRNKSKYRSRNRSRSRSRDRSRERRRNRYRKRRSRERRSRSRSKDRESRRSRSRDNSKRRRRSHERHRRSPSSSNSSNSSSSSTSSSSSSRSPTPSRSRSSSSISRSRSKSS